MASSRDGGFVVLTHVYPQQSGSAAPTVTAAAAPAPAFCTTQHVQSLLEKFLKGETKALGGDWLPRYQSLGAIGGLGSRSWAFRYAQGGNGTGNSDYQMVALLSLAGCLLIFPVLSLERDLQATSQRVKTVQIMIGVTIILLGIVMTISAETLGVYSGIFFWGSLIYISSGALTVAANNKLNKCLVRGALGMNIVSTIIAGLAIIFISLGYVFDMRYGCYGDDESYTYSSCRRYQNYYQSISRGVRGVLLLFTVLEFIISICVSAFGCKAVCDDSPRQVVYIAPANSQVTSEDLLIPPPRAPETTALASVQTEKPPKYDDILP